ncbi:hypothetical protein N2152v2_004378 [Parachlorella kessleri]
MKQVAIKRLLHDLKEVLENPMEDAVALPLEDNLFVWHANVRTSDGPLADVPLHFVLLFPDNYPTQGPEIRLFHPLPHPNIAAHTAGAAQSGGAAYRVAYWDCNPSIDQWSPAFSVASTLVQLHAFLLSPDLLYGTSKVSHEAARKAAMALKVVGHPHQGTCPHPPFPTREDVVLAPRLQRVEVVAPSVNPDLLVHLPTVSSSAAAAEADPEGWQAAGRKAVRTRAEYLQAAIVPPRGNGGSAVDSARGQASGHGSTAHRGGPVATTPTIFSLLGDPQWESLEQLLRPSHATAAAPTSKAVKAGQALGAAADTTSVLSPPASAASPSPAPSVAGPAPATAAARSGRRKPLLDDSILRQHQQSLISDVMKVHQRRREQERQGRMKAADIKGAPDHRQPAAEGTTGSAAWDCLTPDALVQVLLRLEARDVAALGSTCRALKAACSDGEVWRGLLRRSFPGSVLHALALADWRIAYALEANCVLPELRCFFSKATWCDEVLGLPLTFTTNPKTRRVDYLAATCNDLVALAAFQAGLVTKDLEGNAFKAVLPLYITQDHFERAVPYLPGLLRQLAPHRAVGLKPSAEVPADAWLEVLPSALNTCAVLMCDRGLEVSERALNTYVALHRLMMAVCEHYKLWEVVDRRIARFLSSEAERSKSQTPSLGNMLPLLALSRRYDWRDVLPMILAEAQDRSILWICKSDASLESRLMRGPEAALDPALLKGAWEGNKVSRRLFQFHAAFLNLVARPGGCTLGAVMHAIDSLYGRPGQGLRKRFQAETRRILAVESWDDFYSGLGLRTPTPQQQCRALRLSCQSSLRKKYHRAGMDFSKVQGAGVSAILLKGQSYTAPPGMKAIAVDERWHSARPNHFVFLDASCLIYGSMAAVPPPLRGAAGGSSSWHDYCAARSGGKSFTCPPIQPGGKSLELLGIVDYCSSHGARVGRAGTVAHSGDMVVGDNGQHTITVTLPQLGPAVQALWLTMSAWRGARLSDIDQPYICIKDPATDTELCQYFLEDLSPRQRSQHSAVVMCCIYRSPAAKGQWQVAAVGEVGGGDASNYQPLLEVVQGLPPICSGRR